METDDLILRLKKDLRPVTKLPHPAWRFLRWVAVAAFCVGVGLSLMGVREDFSAQISNPLFVLNAVFALLTCVLSAAAAFVLSVPGLERRTLTRALPVLALASWLAFLLILVFSSGDLRPDHNFRCSGSILLFGAFPGALLFAMVRTAAPLRQGWTGALIALSAAALGGLGVQFSCESARPMHVLTWHVLPVLVLGGLGILLGRLLNRPARK